MNADRVAAGRLQAGQAADQIITNAPVKRPYQEPVVLPPSAPRIQPALGWQARANDFSSQLHAADRGLRTGRWAAPDLIAGKHASSPSAWLNADSLADASHLYDLSGNEPILIADRYQKNPLAVHDQARYNEFLKGGQGDVTTTPGLRLGGRGGEGGTSGSHGGERGTETAWNPSTQESNRNSGSGAQTIRGNEPEAGLSTSASVSAVALPGSPADNIREIPTANIQIDPKRFQFRTMPGRAGLEDASAYDPNKAGVIQVWQDPENGKAYVVNGHHRVWLANKLGQSTMAARFLDAPDAKAARAIGAMQNIAEGTATPIDAAKFIRDSRMTPEEMQADGLSLSSPIAKRAVALSNLSEPLFSRVATGEIPEGRAAAIGQHLQDAASQNAVMKLLAAKEKGGKRLTDDEVSELARFAKQAPTGEQTQSALFGPETLQKNYAVEKAQLSSYIRSQIAKDKFFGTVANRAEDLGRGGNVINVGESARIANEARRAAEVYDKLTAYKTPISDALDEGAKRIAEGGNTNEIKRETYQRIRQGIKQIVGSAMEGGVPGTESLDSGRLDQALEAGESAGSQEPRVEPPNRAASKTAIPHVEPPGTKLYSGFDPTLIGPAVRRAQGAYEKYVADPLINRVLHTGVAHADVERIDPELAQKLRHLDAATVYYPQKAQDIVNRLTNGLSREQERLFTLMADKESRENLEANHPAEYKAAMNDPKVQAALRAYGPVRDELASAHVELISVPSS